MLPTIDRYVWYSRDRLRNSPFPGDVFSGACFCCFEHRFSRSAGSPPLLRRACFLAGFAAGTTKIGGYVADRQRRQLNVCSYPLYLCKPAIGKQFLRGIKGKARTGGVSLECTLSRGYTKNPNLGAGSLLTGRRARLEGGVKNREKPAQREPVKVLAVTRSAIKGALRQPSRCSGPNVRTGSGR
jgi:hypothetical protein